MRPHTLVADPAVLHGVFDRRQPPVLTVAPGDRLRVIDLPDATWNHVRQPRPLDPPELLRLPPPGLEHDGHCMVGPIAVEGARPGMTLEVVIHRLRTADWVDYRHRSIVRGPNYVPLANITANELFLGPDLIDRFLNRNRHLPAYVRTHLR